VAIPQSLYLYKSLPWHHCHSQLVANNIGSEANRGGGGSREWTDVEEIKEVMR